MNDDPSEVEVLYIQAHDRSGCLQKISDDIANYFVDKGKFIYLFTTIHYLIKKKP